MARPCEKREWFAAYQSAFVTLGFLGCYHMGAVSKIKDFDVTPMDGTFERWGNLAVDYNGKTYNSLGERFRVCDVILIHARHACGLTELNCNFNQVTIFFFVS